MPLTVAAVLTADIAVRVCDRLPLAPSRNTLPDFCCCTTARWADVMPLALMPVMISWAARSRSVSACSFWSTQLAVLVGVAVGVGVVMDFVVGDGESVVGLLGSVVVGTGTEDDGTVL